MQRRGLLYKDLSRMLENIGIDESSDQINRTVNRRRFSAATVDLRSSNRPATTAAAA